MEKEKTKRRESRFFGEIVSAIKNGSFSTRLSFLFMGFAIFFSNRSTILLKGKVTHR